MIAIKPLRPALAAVALTVAAVVAPAQAAPRFDAYPAGRVYIGPVKKVDFASHEVARALRPAFRAIVRDETAKGANFAGRYRLVTVGCGTACQAVLVIDLSTGRIVIGPEPASAGVAFRRGSRLLRFNADAHYGLPARYYAFRNGRFRAVR